MIDVKEAVVIATRFLKEMYPDDKSRDLRLEEVVLPDDEKFWLITLSFLRREPSAKLEVNLMGGTSKRAYKQIKVNTETGKVQEMVIRNAYGESAQAH